MTPLAKPFSELVAGTLISGKVQHDVETHGTTVLALRFDKGIVVEINRCAAKKSDDAER